MSEPIKPALTEKEWKLESFERTFVETEPYPQTETFSAHLDPGLTVRCEGESVNVPEGARHALAALALFDQPFGFTREDVRVLREAADRDDAELQAGNNARTDIDTVALRSLADRIEALLPSEGK